MNANPHKLIEVGFSAVIIFFTCSQVKAKQANLQCSESVEIYFRSAQYANCSRLGLTEVPKNLNHNLQVLDISYNPIRELNETSFSIYKNLIQIVYQQDNENETIFHPNIFLGLKYLQIVMLDGTSLAKAQIKLPDTITYLTARRTGLRTNNLDFRKLKNLMQLDLGFNYFDYLPKLNKFAPLRVLCFKGNRVKRFSARQIARYCLLEDFLIDENIEAFSYDACECTRLKIWADLKGIILNGEPTKFFPCVKRKRMCGGGLNLITPRMFQLYDNCKENKFIDLDDDYDPMATESEKRRFWFKFLIISISCALVGCIVYLVVSYLIEYRKVRNRKPEHREPNIAADENSISENIEEEDEDEEEKEAKNAEGKEEEKEAKKK